MTTLLDTLPAELRDGLAAGTLLPYLGPGVLGPDAGVPADPLALVGRLTARNSVPGKIRHRLGAAAQFIENFKHRRTLVAGMDEAFPAGQPAPAALLQALVALRPPLLVHTWYDDAPRQALAATGADWSEIQGLAQSEHFGTWWGAYDAQGARLELPHPRVGTPGHVLLYRPLGGRSPASNYLVSDSDAVEVLTEIDIQTPIPAAVQQLRTGRGFLFLGCRFDDQLLRSWARQILKRSAGPHWAVLMAEPTRMEARFLAEVGIRPVAGPLAVGAAAEAVAG